MALHDVIELRLVRPIEVCWDRSFPMPVITLRNPGMVKYDSETRLIQVDTGKGLVLLPLDAESVDRMALAPGVTVPQPSSPTEPLPPRAERSELQNSTVGTVAVAAPGVLVRKGGGK